MDQTDASDALGSAPRNGRRPTMQDIADRVGVSRPLVSIVLRGAAGASEESRTRVLEAAHELGYYPDDSARMLRQRRSRRLGVLFTMRQPFEADLVDALYAEAGRRGYSLVLSHMGPGRSQRVAIDELMRQRIEALIVLAAEGGAGFIDDLPQTMPAVLVGGPRSESPVAEEIRVENASGIAMAVAHLVELGHHRIGYVGPSTGPNAAERLDGYSNAMSEQQLSDYVVTFPSAFSEEGGHAAALRIAQIDPRPTALVCANDRCALGLVETLIRAGIHVPTDVSVVGFDDSSVARLPFLQLTSVRPDPDRMAAFAIDAAERRFRDQHADPETTFIPPVLVVRGTTTTISENY